MPLHCSNWTLLCATVVVGLCGIALAMKPAGAHQECCEGPHPAGESHEVAAIPPVPLMNRQATGEVILVSGQQETLGARQAVTSSEWWDEPTVFDATSSARTASGTSQTEQNNADSDAGLSSPPWPNVPPTPVFEGPSPVSIPDTPTAESPVTSTSTPAWDDLPQAPPSAANIQDSAQVDPLPGTPGPEVAQPLILPPAPLSYEEAMQESRTSVSQDSYRIEETQRSTVTSSTTTHTRSVERSSQVQTQSVQSIPPGGLDHPTARTGTVAHGVSVRRELPSIPMTSTIAEAPQPGMVTRSESRSSASRSRSVVYMGFIKPPPRPTPSATRPVTPRPVIQQTATTEELFPAPVHRIRQTFRFQSPRAESAPVAGQKCCPPVSQPVAPGQSRTSPGSGVR